MQLSFGSNYARLLSLILRTISSLTSSKSRVLSAEREKMPKPSRLRALLGRVSERGRSTGRFTLLVTDCVKLFTVWSVLLLCFVAGRFLCLFLSLLTWFHLRKQETSNATEKAGEKAKATPRGNRKVGFAVPR